MFLAQGVLDTGIGEHVIGGGVAGLVGSVLLYVLRIIYIRVLGDKKQIDMEHSLVLLASTSLERTDALLESQKDNTEALQKLTDTITSVFAGMEDRIKTDIAAVRQELIRNARTRIIVQKTNGQIIADLTAIPEIDEEGNPVLVVSYDPVGEKQNDS